MPSHPNGPRESGSMDMDIDDGPVACHHPHRCDTSPDPSGGQMPPDFPFQGHQVVGSVQSSRGGAGHSSPDPERQHGSNGSSQLMIPPSPPSPVKYRGGVFRLESSPSRKRKRTHDSPQTQIRNHNHTPDNGAFTDGANSQSSRRIRPRLWTQQNLEFPPLLYMSPGQERGPPVEEETISASHYPPDATNPSSSIRRYFSVDDTHEQDARPRSTADNDPEDPKRRSDTANSLAEVALASTVPPRLARLSTLQDIWLPRPFEETERLSLDIIKVHERGLEAGPSFLQPNSRRTGGLSVSRGPADPAIDVSGQPVSEHDVDVCLSPFTGVTMLPLEPSPITYFPDKPICDSPDSIDPADEGGLTHFEIPATRARFGSFRGRS